MCGTGNFSVLEHPVNHACAAVNTAGARKGKQPLWAAAAELRPETEGRRVPAWRQEAPASAIFAGLAQANPAPRAADDE